jgi:hypothetical protein
MKKYYTKKYRNKRRNVKKYKKSQKNGKTRKYKVSKNINRHYSLRKGKGKGIRRHMSGGLSFYDFHTKLFAFNIDPNKLRDYINYKYGLKDPRPNGNPKDDPTALHKFTNLKKVAHGKVAITNTSLGFYFRKDNRYEQISVFACYRGETLICYVIARCVSDYPCHINYDDYEPGKGYHDKPTEGMEEKILFVDCRKVNKLEFKVLTTDNQKKAFEKFVKTEAKNKNITEEDLRHKLNPDGGYHLFEFGTLNTDQNRSSNVGDTYRVIILPIDNQALDTFFNDQAPPIQAGDEKYATQDIEFRKAAGNGADGAFAVLSLIPAM